jgi:hypothetical protein
MVTTIWRTEIYCCLTPGEVVATVQRFVDGLEGFNLSTIPGDLRPKGVRTPSDVSQWAFRLAAASIESSNEDPTLEELATVFGEAAKRLGLLTLVSRAKGFRPH